ncbi:hypothetical protein T484DRAFT_1823842 [Baffinella frigidus]|nr:hypothetical protein T484DRAFT_1823842 [Cryptophyta sp. CCMP2293]
MEEKRALILRISQLAATLEASETQKLMEEKRALILRISQLAATLEASETQEKRALILRISQLAATSEASETQVASLEASREMDEKNLQKMADVQLKWQMQEMERQLGSARAELKGKHDAVADASNTIQLQGKHDAVVDASNTIQLQVI